MDELNVSATALSQCLTAIQQLTIKTSLLKLRLSNPEPSAQFTFFAKINGREKDYFIIRSITLPSTNIKQSFYWSNDSGLNFAKFSSNDLDEFVNKISPLIRGNFSGNPNHKYKDPTIKIGQKIEMDDQILVYEEIVSTKNVSVLIHLTFCAYIMQTVLHYLHHSTVTRW